MTMQANGSTMSAEDEAVHYGMPEATEWETHETQYSNPYSDPEAEWEEEVHYSTPEAEWETHETHYSNPYSTPEAERDPFLGNVLGSIGGALGLESEYEDFASPEAEWEEEVHYSTPEAEWETH